MNSLETLLMNLRLFTPNLIGLSDKVSLKWKKVDKLLSEMFKGRLIEAGGNSIPVSVSMYDLIISARKGVKTSRSMLSFIDKIFERLNEKLKPIQLRQIKTNIENLLVSMDAKFYNYLGELAILDSMLNTGLNLVSTEYKLANGKSIDFKFNSENNAVEYLFEIMNIQLSGKSLDAKPDDIAKFFNYRLKNKFADKTKNLNPIPYFRIIPVLWGSFEELKGYINYFQTRNIDEQIAIEPFSYGMFTDVNEDVHHFFVMISSFPKSHI